MTTHQGDPMTPYYDADGEPVSPRDVLDDEELAAHYADRRTHPRKHDRRQLDPWQDPSERDQEDER